MRTIDSVLTEASKSLSKISESPVLDAELLLCYLTGYSRARLISSKLDHLIEPLLTEYQELIRRRLACEPIAYIVGRKEFWGMDFEITPEVLVPRPETELLVEKALEFAKNLPGSIRVLDLGTGSGCIAISLAHEMAKLKIQASISAVDLNQKALELAKRNAATHEVQVNFFESDWFSNLGEETFDIIVANPPYVPIKDRNQQISREPEAALYSGADGFDDIRKLLRTCRPHLTPRGAAFFEFGIGQEKLLNQEFKDINFSFFEDLAGIKRVLSFHKG